MSLIVVLPGVVPAQSDLLGRAESAFAEGIRRREAGDRGAASFREAAACFEQLWQEGSRNPALARNRGNAWLLAGDLPRAILAYRQGLRLRPGDRLLRDSLAHAREQVVFVEGSTAGRPVDLVGPAWLAGLETGWVFLLAGLAHLAGCVCLTRHVVTRRGGYLLGGMGFLAVGLALGWLVVRKADGPPRPLVVVSRDDVRLRKGDGEAFPSWLNAPLERGVEGVLLHQRGPWLQIELASGEIGWVHRTEVVGEG